MIHQLFDAQMLPALKNLEQCCWLKERIDLSSHEIAAEMVVLDIVKKQVHKTAEDIVGFVFEQKVATAFP